MSVSGGTVRRSTHRGARCDRHRGRAGGTAVRLFHSVHHHDVSVRGDTAGGVMVGAFFSVDGGSSGGVTAGLLVVWWSWDVGQRPLVPLKRRGGDGHGSPHGATQVDDKDARREGSGGGYDKISLHRHRVREAAMLLLALRTVVGSHCSGPRSFFLNLVY